MILFAGSNSCYKGVNALKNIMQENKGYVPLYSSNNMKPFKYTYMYRVSVNNLVLYDFSNLEGLSKYIDVLQGAINRTDKILYGLLKEGPIIELKEVLNMEKLLQSIKKKDIMNNSNSLDSLAAEIVESLVKHNRNNFWDKSYWVTYYFNRGIPVSLNQVERHIKLYYKRLRNLIYYTVKEQTLLYMYSHSDDDRNKKESGACLTLNSNYIKYLDYSVLN